MTEIDQKTLAKLVKLMPRLASDHAGEAAATAAAMVRMLASAGLSLHDVVAHMQREPAQRVVYRDRVIEKVVEKVVYRDAPVQPDADVAPMTAAEAAEAANVLATLPDLTENQRAFLDVVKRTASRGEALFRLSPKQWIWLLDLHDRHISSAP